MVGGKCEKCLKKDIEYKIMGTDGKGLSKKELNVCGDCQKVCWKENCCGASRGWSDSRKEKEIHCNKCPWERKAFFVGKEKEDEEPVQGAKRNEKHICPSCLKEYYVPIMDITEGDDTYEIPYHFIFHNKASNKCFWDSPETKQKVQEYRQKFSKWLDFRGQKAGGVGFAIAINQKQLSLVDLKELKKEILAIPPSDDLICLRAFSYKDNDNYDVETRGMPYKVSLVESVNEAIKVSNLKSDEVCERYGNLIEDDSNKISRGMIALLIGGAISLVAGIAFLLIRKLKTKKSNNYE
ncbi:MAG: hypothetical protein mread185_000267 [Mycoplasmataceae bacterium]|nr:MAG: hypothetical protein mread185_000267 [Mycoplasmataceae bacterium]